MISPALKPVSNQLFYGTQYLGIQVSTTSSGIETTALTGSEMRQLLIVNGGARQKIVQWQSESLQTGGKEYAKPFHYVFQLEFKRHRRNLEWLFFGNLWYLIWVGAGSLIERELSEILALKGGIYRDGAWQRRGARRIFYGFLPSPGPWSASGVSPGRLDRGALKAHSSCHFHIAVSNMSEIIQGERKIKLNALQRQLPLF